MQFGFALGLSNIDLWSIDLLDAHLDLLDTDIPSKYFVSLHSVFKTSSRYVFKTSPIHVFNTSSRRLQRNNFPSSKTSCKMSSRLLQDVLEDVKCYAEDVLKTSSRHVLKTSWRRLQDQQMFAGLDVAVFMVRGILLGKGF